MQLVVVVVPKGGVGSVWGAGEFHLHPSEVLIWFHDCFVFCVLIYILIFLCF
jgi:hypothetical protein